MSNKKLRPFIVKVSVLGYFPLFNILLSQVTSTTFLGINLDTCLNWKCHLGYLKNKLLKILWIINTISYFVNTSAMFKL